jgi:hypothetical protein
MKSPGQNGFHRDVRLDDAQETLRLIATMPAPFQLEERVKARMQAVPSRGEMWLLSGLSGWMTGSAMRAAAAAAIVLVVAGGGWAVYSHIQLPATPTAVVEPQMPATTGGFSAAGATRKPQTLEGPVVATPVAAEQQDNVKSSDTVAKHKIRSKRSAIEPGKHGHAPAKPKSLPDPAER